MFVSRPAQRATEPAPPRLKPAVVDIPQLVITNITFSDRNTSINMITADK